MAMLRQLSNRRSVVHGWVSCACERLYHLPHMSRYLFLLAVSQVALAQLYKNCRGLLRRKYGLAYLVEPVDFRNVRGSSRIHARCAL